MKPGAPRLASTVILLRPSEGGPEVFLVRRNRAVAFMPSAWVFPGGRVDDRDEMGDHPGVRGGASTHGLPVGRARRLRVAAARETFEESGIWLGSGCPDAACRAALGRREAPVRLEEVLERSGARLDLDRLRPWSRWVTPAQEPRRYDTWFFTAIVTDQLGEHDRGETVDSRWMAVREAVERAESGDLPMAPPTWWTLRQLALLPTVGAIRAHDRDLRPIEPILREVDGALSLLLPGHPLHGEPPRHDLPPSIIFGQGRWWASPIEGP